MMATIFFKAIEESFAVYANEQQGKKMQQYLKTPYTCLGVPTAIRRKITKEVIKDIPIKTLPNLIGIVDSLWNTTTRDYHYTAITVFGYYKKLWDKACIVWLEKCIVEHSWWDTVDHVGSECIGTYFKKFPTQIIPITAAWNKSNNIWLQRSSIMFQKSFKANTNTALLQQYILQHANSKEFFVQKAIGWSLREYAKVNANWVLQFVHTHTLPNLSKREALKHFGE
jgi:3-methyladenine DNA glycosylase AlkD